MVPRRPRWPLPAVRAFSSAAAAFAFALALAASASARAGTEPEPPAPVAAPVAAPTAPPLAAPGQADAPASSPEPSAAVAPSAPKPPASAERVPMPVPTPRTRWVATLGVLSVPRLISFEAHALLGQRLGVGLVFEYLPPGIAKFGEDTTLSLLQVGVQGRYFPFADSDGWFSRSLYGALGVGYQYSRADSSKFGSEVDYLTESMYFAPKIGLLVTLKSGLTLGGDLGATLPLGATTSFASDGTEDSNARKAAKTFGMFVIPTLTLFRVGYSF
ncbi:MAG: hypothetical protein IPF92_26365 [Myxococcales bacterium]|nr:hypothetical protein [Myxococcales bacterium]